MSDDKHMFHVEQDGNVSRETPTQQPKPCPICDSIGYNKLMDLKDHSISGHSFAIYQCQKCELRITHPMPCDLAQYYASDDYISHSKTNKGLINKLYLVAQKYNLAYKFRAALKHSRGTSWLDYGSGAGDFMQYASKRNIDVKGVEIHPGSRDRCRTQGLMVYHPEEYGAPDEHFDLITMWHVLEHIENINELLGQHHRKLKANGSLIVAVPNPESYDASKFRQHWAAYDVPRHLWHFNEDNIEALAVRNGFALCQTLPMHLDAFYISMLSSKYQKGFLITALLHAAFSNFSAAIKNTPYSSQIYILRKMAK